jgi:hypothetical protein
VVELVAIEINGAAAQAGVGLTNKQIPGISPLLQMSAIDIAAMHPWVSAAENRPTEQQNFQSSVKRVKSLLKIETDLEAEPNAKRFRAAEEEPLWPRSVVSYMVGQHQLCS